MCAYDSSCAQMSRNPASGRSRVNSGFKAAKTCRCGAPLTPGVAFAQRGDVRHVMPAVPGILRQQKIHRRRAPLRMAEPARPIGGAERAQENHPALVEIVDQHKGRLDRRRLGISKFSPQGFFVGLDGGLVFRERELEARQGVHVAVGDVVDQLADGPAAWTIRRIDLRGRQIRNGGGEARGSVGNHLNVFAALFGREAHDRLEFTDWVAQIWFHVMSPADYYLATSGATCKVQFGGASG